MKIQKQLIGARLGVAAIVLGLTPACALEDGDFIDDLERSDVDESSADEREREGELGELDRELGLASASEDELDQPNSNLLGIDGGAEDQARSLGGVGSLCGPGSSRSVEADFNGDGYADLAIGVPNEGVGDILMAGAVNVLFGTNGDGLDEDDDEYWDQNKISGDMAEEGDHFGWSLAAGDFNCDGYDDLAIGVPDEDVAGVVDAGMVHVMYGSADGLDPDTTTTWSQGTPLILGFLEEADRFGYTLATGDFDGIACDDLAVGVPFEDLTLGGGDDAGMVNVIYSGILSTDLTPIGNEVLRQGFNGIDDFPEFLDYFGASLVAGNFNADGEDDLAIGVPGEDLPGVLDAGLVSVIYGTALGGLITLGVANDQTWTQDTMSAGTDDEPLDYTGLSLAAGDFDGNGVDDLAVGVPLEDWISDTDAGVVITLNGGSSGLSSAGSQLLRQGAGVVSGLTEPYDQFGLALAAGDFDGNGSDDLAVGVPFEDFGGLIDAGRVHAIYSSGGVFFADQSWDQDTPGIDGVAEDHDAFGSSLTTGDYDGNSRSDLSVGVPLEDVGDIIDAGWVNTIYSKANGLDEDDDQHWHQDVPGVDGVAEQGDLFGCALH